MYPRADHIGSLKRPAVLLERKADYKVGKCTADDLRALITDGEFRREIFYEGVFDQLSGLKEVHNPPSCIFQSFNFVQSWPFTRICVEKLKRTRPLYGDDFDSLKRIAGSQNISKLKVTMGAPTWYYHRHGKFTYEATAYTGAAEYFSDVASIYREEIQDLYSRGCRCIQFDDPVMSTFCDEEYRRRMKADGVDPDDLLEMYIQVYNDCLRDKPFDMEAGLHICRGNVLPDGSRFTSGGYALLAQRLFTTLNCNCFYLEFDTKHSGDFEPLRFMPRNKRVVLGLVSTKTPKLEDPALLCKSILQAAEAMTRGPTPRTINEALNQLSISPQCGFASHSRGFEFVTHEDMVKKLALVRDVACSVWEQEPRQVTASL